MKNLLIILMAMFFYGCVNTIPPHMRAINNDINDQDMESCIEYALAKQAELAKIGVESKLATLWTQPTGRYDDEYHMVCIIHTETGDVVFDNRYDYAYYCGDVWYRWDKIQAENGEWFKINGVVKTELRSKFTIGKEVTPPLYKMTMND